MKFKYVLSQYPRITDTDSVEVKEFLDPLSYDNLNQIVLDYRYICQPASFGNELTIYLPHRFNLPSLNRPIHQIVKDISSYFELLPNQIKTREGGISVCIPNIEENVQLIKDAFRIYEYRLSTPIEESSRGQFVWLDFEQQDDTQEIRDKESTLYFLMPYHKRSLIRHFSRFPYQNGLFHSFRNLYFIRGSIPHDEIKKICAMKCEANPDCPATGRFALFTLNLSKIPDDVKLYLDPNNHYGIYTPATISPDAIISMEELII